MVEQPFPKRFGPYGTTGVTWVNGIGLTRDGTSDGIGVENQARFGALFDDFDDARVLAPKRRSDPDARRITNGFDETRNCIGTRPWIRQRNFVCTQSDDDQVGMVVADEP